MFYARINGRFSVIKKKIKSIVGKHKGRDFLIYCPGKNIKEWQKKVAEFVKQNNLLIIGSNKLTELINLDYHMFTNNDKYKAYGNMVNKSSVLLLGSHILKSHIVKHKPKYYVQVDYTDRDKYEPINYNRQLDRIEGYYRTSGHLAIMICHIMGARKIYIAGMSGFTFNFDGTVHYYKAEIKRDKKSRKEWLRKYDKPVKKSLDNLKKYGIDFQIITPTIYKKHYNPNILREQYVCEH